MVVWAGQLFVHMYRHFGLCVLLYGELGFVYN